LSGIVGTQRLQERKPPAFGLMCQTGVTVPPNALLVTCYCIWPNCTCYGARTRWTHHLAFSYSFWVPTIPRFCFFPILMVLLCVIMNSFAHIRTVIPNQRCDTSFQEVRKASVLIGRESIYWSTLLRLLFSFAMNHRQKHGFVQTYVSRY